MRSYHYLAQIYDILQEEINYALWYDKFCQWRDERDYQFNNILEIGAGTGNMTAHFISDNIQVTALEPTEAMLQVLVEKFGHQKRLLNYFCGDVNSFQTAKQYDALVGFLDVLNYVPYADIAHFWQRVVKLTKPGGLIYFDISTRYKLEQVIANHTFAESLSDFAYIWQNDYDSNAQVLDFELTIFSETSAGHYQRQVEKHRQYAHTVADIRASLPKTLQIVEALGDDFAPLEATSERAHLFIERL